MTDKELLELAAKAACVRLIDETFDYDEFGRMMVDFGRGTTEWNPLADDGDALRLAVKLKISPIQIIDEPICAAYWTDVMCCNQSHGDDPYAATRRAIVRAAAKIGERMK